MDIKAVEALMSGTCGLVKNRPVLVGVSGGPDSMSLCHLLVSSGYPCIAAHFDHNLRPESAVEAGQVRIFAGNLDIPFTGGSGDVSAYAIQGRLSLEEAARNLRYRFLFEEARRWSAQAVAVAHNADDQVETVLMHLIRGSGLGGLKGMSYRSVLPEWDAALPLVRPLLGTWRTEIIEYCREHSLDPAMDRTNEEPIFLRNRVRLELIPSLVSYNPQVKAAIWRLAKTLEGDQEVLDQAAADAWKRCCTLVYREEVQLSAVEFQQLPVGLQRSVLRQAVACIHPGLRDIDFETVERGLAFTSRPNGRGFTELSGGVGLLLEGSNFVILTRKALQGSEAWPRIDQGACLPLELPGTIELAPGWLLSAGKHDSRFEKPWEECEDTFQAWLDMDALSVDLCVRPRRPGDLFAPLGLGGHVQKLSDFMVNSGMPRRGRAGWPMVVAAAGIAWVPGYRPAHFCRVTDKTKHIIHLHLYRAS